MNRLGKLAIAMAQMQSCCDNSYYSNMPSTKSDGSFQGRGWNGECACTGKHKNRTKKKRR